MSEFTKWIELKNINIDEALEKNILVYNDMNGKYLFGYPHKDYGGDITFEINGGTRKMYDIVNEYTHYVKIPRFPDEVGNERLIIERFISKISGEKLGEPFSRILFDNLWNLYES